LGLPDHTGLNIWLKEYLIQAHGKVTKGRLIAKLAPVYANIWQRGVLKNWRRCDILHFLLHGTASKIVTKAREEGSTIIGEAVNQHPEAVEELLSEEADRLGMKRVLAPSKVQTSQLEELEKCDYLLCPSQLVKASFVVRGFDEKKIAVIPYGVNLGRFWTGGVPESNDAHDPFRVICVAQITPRKGHVYLLEAWKRLRLVNAELLLIGALSADMKKTLHRYEGQFRHIPHVSNDQLRNYYSRSAVFVLPSIEDGFAVVCGEAMGCGLPVITTSNNGAAEIVSDGIDGFVVPIRSVEGLGERIQQLYNNAELRSQMASNARSKSLADLGWDKYAEKLVSFYRHTSPSVRPSAELSKVRCTV
jgi:glycosyltransferase involved in cell wall biosynthesis